MKFLIQKIKSESALDKGFTLIELLVATIIMSSVVTLAGYGFVLLLEENKKAEFESQRRTNLNRALDYIANEVRMANTIEAGTASGEVMKLTIPTVKTNYPVNIPNPTENDALSYEFENSPAVTYSTANSTGVWADANSKAITRNGNFLVDAIKAPTSPPDTTTDCPSTTGTLKGSDGFYVCIHTSGKQVDLYLYGKLSDNPSEAVYNKPLEVKSTVFTRAEPTN